MATIKGFIFDLDGVLVNTTKYHFAAWQRIAEKLGFTLKEKSYEELKGLAREEALEQLLEIGGKEITSEEFEELLSQKNEWYLQSAETLSAEDVMPGVVDFLEIAQELNLKLAVGTVSKNSELVLERSGLEDYFEVVVNGNDIQESKPNPEVFLRAAHQLEVDPEALIVFEDSKVGIEAANRGGFRSVGLGKRKLLPDADLVLKTLLEAKPAEVINQLIFKLNP